MSRGGPDTRRAVVLLSGGLDSYTAAAVVSREGRELYALSVNYGQRHQRELEAARAVARALGVARHITIDLDLVTGPGGARIVVVGHSRLGKTALLAGALIGWLLPRRASAPAAIAHLQMDLRPAERLVGSIASVRPSRTAFAISPDGRMVVFAGMRQNTMQLYVRALNRREATPIAGTDATSC